LSDDPPQPADPDPWIIEGVSGTAVARAEHEAARRGMTLAHWLEDAIEHALLTEKSAPGAPPEATD